MIDAGVQENCCKTCLNTQAYIPRELTKVNRSYMYLSHVITHNLPFRCVAYLCRSSAYPTLTHSARLHSGCHIGPRKTFKDDVTTNGIRNIMEDQYALKLALWQTSLFRLQNVKLKMTI